MKMKITIASIALGLLIPLYIACNAHALSVYSGDIVNGEVKNQDLGPNAVSTDKIAYHAVESSDLAPDSVTTEKIPDASIPEGKLNFLVYTQDEVNDIVDDLQQQITALQTLLQHFSLNGSEITISGANLHIVNGTGGTDNINGLGNLIVGYNEPRNGTNDRSGSHNIVSGALQNYTSYGGFIAGVENTVSAPYATVSGGNFNEANGNAASVCGGNHNIAEAFWSSVSGGYYNTSTAYFSSVCGGMDNEASGIGSSVSGGASRSATGDYDWVAGSLGEDY